MVFNSKQLEELENIHDSTGAFEEEGDDEAGFDEVGEAAMDWRRGLIEEAAENVKRAKTRAVEPHLQYPVHSMLFDREARRFARVQRSVPGYLKIVYLSGGDREYGTLDVAQYLKDQGAQRRLSELSEQLGMADIDVATELERLGITPLEELEEPDAAATAETAVAVPPPLPVAARKRPAAPVPAVVDEEDAAESEDDEVEASEEAVDVDVDAEANALPAAKNSKATPKAAAAAKRAPPAKVQAKPLAKPAPAKATAAPTKAAAPAKGKGGSSNPIDDPNGYIKANYATMSNRELARVTGLSEHTIRRKLGEWSLKRKKEG